MCCRSLQCNSTHPPPSCIPPCFPLSATPAANDCLTLRTLVEETYRSGKRGYDNPYDWLEYSGNGVYIPQCLQNGSYATIQCSNASLPVDEPYSYYRTRYCWCVDPATGIPTSRDHGDNIEPSLDECPYYNTTALCQVRGMSLYNFSFLFSFLTFCKYEVSMYLEHAVALFYAPLLCVCMCQW